jgi:hypothetical protein
MAPGMPTWARYEFPASVLFLSSRHMVALWFEGLSGFDGVACRTPPLPEARLSETELSMTVAIGRPQSRSPSLTGIAGFAVRDFF